MFSETVSSLLQQIKNLHMVYIILFKTKFTCRLPVNRKKVGTVYVSFCYNVVLEEMLVDIPFACLFSNR